MDYADIAEGLPIVDPMEILAPGSETCCEGITDGNGKSLQQTGDEERIGSIELLAEEFQNCPQPGQPICSFVDHTSLILEWPQYSGCEFYSLELAFRIDKKISFRDQGRKPRKNSAPGLNSIESRKEVFSIACSQYFSDGIPASLSGPGHIFEGVDCLDWVPVYNGKEKLCKVENLMPGMGYLFRVRVLPKSLPNSPSELLASNQVLIFTVPSAPSAPEAPLLVDRGRTTLKLKWSPPIIIGGMPISEYCVEMKPAPVNELHMQRFEQVYAGTALAVKVARLSPGATYVFRVQALNCIGRSSYSKEATYTTAPSVPAAPPPPKLLSSSPTSISVHWEEPENQGSPISFYTLEADDGQEGSFSVIYTGENRSCELDNLKSGRIYRFRVLAHNDVGKGAFSLPAEVSTMQSPPSAPSSLSIKGRAATSAVVSWDPPQHDGGSPVTGYQLEFNMRSKINKWIQAYDGESNAHKLVGLHPGCQYRARVRAKNVAGIGGFSQEVTFTTTPGPPQAPSSPQFLERYVDAVKVCWCQPNHDGGSAILGYRLEMLNPEAEENQESSSEAGFVCVYRGLELFAFVDGLVPGRRYLFRVQAMSKIGSSAWSCLSEAKTEAGAPSAPEAPVVLRTLDTSISLRWNPPNANGSCISSYKLQMSDLGYGVHPHSEMLRFCLSDDGGHYIAETEYVRHSETQTEVVNDEGTGIQTETLHDQQTTRYMLQNVYHGPAVGYTMKNLEAYTSYAFCLQAFNAVGASDYSQITVVMTSPSSPLPPAPPVVVGSSTFSILLQWECPERDNGAEVTSFSLEMRNEDGNQMLEGTSAAAYKKSARKKKAQVVSSEPTRQEASEQWTRVYSGPLRIYEVSSLLPGHSYCFQLRAYNEHGASAPTKVTATTKAASPLPPSAPTFSAMSPTSVRVRWSPLTYGNGAGTLRYKLLMDYNKLGHLQKVYEGESTSYKVTKLTPGKTYQAAVQAINSAGVSDPSEVASITLPEIPLPALGAPKLKCISKGSVLVSWEDLAQPNAAAVLDNRETCDMRACNNHANEAGNCKLPEILSYTLQMETAAGKLLQIYEGTVPRFEVKNLVAGKSYKFRVRANGAPEGGSGPWSAFSKWVAERDESRAAAPAKMAIKGATGAAAAGKLYQGLTMPWSLGLRRLMAVVGIISTLSLAVYSNREEAAA